MTETIAAIPDEKVLPPAAPVTGTPILRLWGGLRLFLPCCNGRRYLLALPLWQAIIVAVLNISLWFVWILVLHATMEWFQRHNPDSTVGQSMSYFIGPVGANNVTTWFGMFHATARSDWDVVRHASLVEVVPQVGGILLLWLLSLSMLYFILLPFAARHGSNRACALHVLKTSLLGTGISHLAGAALVGLVVAGAHYHTTVNLYAGIVRGLAAVCVASIYGTITLARAGKADYRRPKDMPKLPDPLCEFCGYNLSVSPIHGRCPECGRPVIESLGSQVRVPTMWERSPRWWNPLLVFRVARDMVLHPMQTYARMPAYSGKEMVERWLIVAIALVAVEAFFLWPAVLFLTEGRGQMDDPQLYIGSFVIAVIWAALAVMMVGIETAGVATVAHFRGQHVDLGTAAKVTGYASILLLFWIFIGSLQLLAAALISVHPGWHVVSARFRPYAFLATLSMAQIGGLLWFEWTVYRGLRVVRFANT